MDKRKMKKLLILNLPYFLVGLFATNLGEAWRLAEGADSSAKILSFFHALPIALNNPFPSFHPLDLLIGILCGAGLRLAVYLKGKNAKKYRHNVEYGSARWGTAKDIEPFIAPKFEDNVILTKTERLMMSNRPKNPANARNKNVLIIGGSGSGKTRFWLKPNLLQMHSSYVVTDPKGSIVIECGNALLKHGYTIKIFNTINFQKSMHYNPFAYIHSEKDILKLVTTLIANTKGDGKAGDEFWTKAETLLYCALIHTTRNTVNGVEKVTAALFCDNEQCETRKLRKFVHFASPKAMNIVGLSEANLEKFIGKGWLHSYMDVFFLDKHRSEIVQMEGFGVRSWQNLWDAIQHSRITTFEQYLTAMDIPMVGSTASKAICQRFRGNLAEFETAVCQSFDFTQLPDFGETLHRNIHQWFRSEENWMIWTELRRLVCIKTYQPPAASTDMGNPFVGKTLVVTGKVEPYTRDGINTKIESLGAHAGSSVSSKTDYLICGENAGSKLAKAQELGIKILSPDKFFRMAGESA